METTTVKATVAARVPQGYRETYVQYEKMLDLPPAAPTPGRLHTVTASARIRSAVSEAGKLSISAGLDLRVSYETKADGALITVPTATLVEKTLDWDGAQPQDRCRAMIDVEEVAFEPVRDESGEIKKVRVKAFLRILAELEKENTAEVLSAVSDESLQVKTEEVPVLSYLAGMEKPFVLSGRIHIGRGLPEVHHVVSASGILRELNWTLGEGEWRLSGSLYATVVYSGQTGEEEELFSVEESFPFRQNFQLPGLLPEDIAQPRVELERVKAEVLHDSDERAVILECFADAKAALLPQRVEKIRVMADVFSIREKLTVEEKPVTFSAFEGVKKQVLSLRETVTLPKEQAMEALWPVDSRVLPIVKDGKLTGATVAVTVEYLARVDGLPGIFSRRAAFDVELKEGAALGSGLLLQDVDVRPVGRNEMQVKAEVSCLSAKETLWEKKVPSRIMPTGDIIEQPSLVFYRPFAGEEAFAAAKALGVEVQTVLRAAGLGEDGKLPGSLLVLNPRRG